METVLAELRAAPNRSVAALQAAIIANGLLPHAKFFIHPMPTSDTSRRPDWHARARVHLDACQTVFLDPDTGLIRPSVSPRSLRSLDYVLWEEALDWWEAGRSLIVYQHVRAVPASEQATRREEVMQRLGGGYVQVLGDNVRWMVVPVQDHHGELRGVVDEFISRCHRYWPRFRTT